MTSVELDLAYAPMSEVAKLIERKSVTPLDVTTKLLERIERLNPLIAAYYTVFADSALAEAAKATEEIASGGYRGGMHGVPVAVKDICETGLTTGGSKSRATNVATSDATVVTKLREAGAVMMGKLATYEFALGTPTKSSYFPPARNAWNTDYDPGGSSSGSGAAIASGLAYAAIGTDTGGSIRWPAFANGIVGMKATYGRVSRAGIFPLSWNLDHAGPMTRTVADAAVMLQAIAGEDARDVTTAPGPVPDFSAKLGTSIAGMKLGVPWALIERCDPEILALFKAALEQYADLGAIIVDVDTFTHTQVMAAHMPMMAADAASYHLPQFRSAPEDLSPYLRAMVGAGLAVSAVQYLDCQRAREVIRKQIISKFSEIDAYILPTSGVAVPKILDAPGNLAELAGDGFVVYTGIFNLTGMPAMSIPCGFSAAGMPVALQLAGRPFDEATVFQLGDAYEKATRWHEMHPEL
ncbi:hypothetical protein AYO38_08325 [bacterium SCGC AG-212-C10]|nr:hypothetical protein AYO38_08325 [bacterium SCGC AG-212-C10]